jgi:hypothetical protein
VLLQVQMDMYYSDLGWGYDPLAIVLKGLVAVEA